jgi:hypothetical protein
MVIVDARRMTFVANRAGQRGFLSERQGGQQLKASATKGPARSRTAKLSKLLSEASEHHRPYWPAATLPETLLFPARPAPMRTV